MPRFQIRAARVSLQSRESLMVCIGIVLGVAFLVGIARAEDVPLIEEQVIEIRCELTQAPSKSDVPVFSKGSHPEKTLGTYHYKLWLPKGYLADTNKRWPCMFIMSPGGKATMGNMSDYLKRKGFVVVMLVEAKNGPWYPIVGNFLAAHDDVARRVRIADKYATGFSGGARGSSVFVQMRPGFRGLLLQGAGAAFDHSNKYAVAGIKRNPDLYVAMLMGKSDKNRTEVERLHSVLNGSRFEAFDYEGGHTAPPPEALEEALEWLDARIAGKPPAGRTGSGSSSPSDTSFDDFFKKK